MADEQEYRDECDGYQYDSYDGDLHSSSSHATVALQFFPGHRNPFRLPSIMLVFTKSGSIQKCQPHFGHLKRYRRSILLSLVQRSSLSPLSTSRLKAAIPAGLRTKT